MNRIQVTNAGAVLKGEYITQADDEQYQPGSLVPVDDYSADEQDWQHVIAYGGHDDVGWMTLAYYSGEQYQVHGDWTQTVWRLVDADGEPIRDEVEA